MSKKYELTNESKVVNGCAVYRIKALKDFGTVKKGDMGGYIQSSINLSHKDDCWIFGNSEVYENAKVYRKAIVYGDARVYGNAKVYRNAIVRC